MVVGDRPSFAVSKGGKKVKKFEEKLKNFVKTFCQPQNIFGFLSTATLRG